MKMILNDGTELDNLTLNGNNYVSETEITEDVFVDNLETVTIVSDDETQELHHCKLIQIAHYEDGWYFIIDEMTQAEIDKDNTEAQTFYTAMMTDTLMEV